MTLKVVWLPVLGHSMIKGGLMLGISVCMVVCWWDLNVVCWAAGGTQCCMVAAGWHIT